MIDEIEVLRFTYCNRLRLRSKDDLCSKSRMNLVHMFDTLVLQYGAYDECYFFNYVNKVVV